MKEPLETSDVASSQVSVVCLVCLRRSTVAGINALFPAAAAASAAKSIIILIAGRLSTSQ